MFAVLLKMIEVLHQCVPRSKNETIGFQFSKIHASPLADANFFSNLSKKNLAQSPSEKPQIKHVRLSVHIRKLSVCKFSFVVPWQQIE
jgi:hypothetical protein